MDHKLVELVTNMHDALIALGVGVDMLFLDKHATTLSKQGLPVNEAWIEAGRLAAARGRPRRHARLRPIGSRDRRRRHLM